VAETYLRERRWAELAGAPSGTVIRIDRPPNRALVFERIGSGTWYSTADKHPYGSAELPAGDVEILYHPEGSDGAA
jgi:hypothetical protein